MKKFVCVILALALALIAGCSSGETSAPDNSPAAAVPSPVETYDLPEASPPVPVPFSRLDTPEPTASLCLHRQSQQQRAAKPYRPQAVLI